MLNGKIDHYEYSWDNMDDVYLTKHQYLSEAFIKRNIDRLSFDVVIHQRHLSESFINEISETINWYAVSSVITEMADVERLHKHLILEVLITNCSLPESFRKLFE